MRIKIYWDIYENRGGEIIMIKLFSTYSKEIKAANIGFSLNSNEEKEIVHCSRSGICIVNYVNNGYFKSDVIAFDDNSITKIKVSDIFEYEIKEKIKNVNYLCMKNASNSTISRIKYTIVGQLI